MPGLGLRYEEQAVPFHLDTVRDGHKERRGSETVTDRAA